MPYIASWEGDDALEQLQRTAQLIDALARRIERVVAPQEEAEPAHALRAAS